jgi:Mn-dependent DtxR family transcriptional regulator
LAGKLKFERLAEYVVSHYQGEPVRTIDIAHGMGMRTESVYTLLKIAAKNGLVGKVRYRGWTAPGLTKRP